MGTRTRTPRQRRRDTIQNSLLIGGGVILLIIAACFWYYDDPPTGGWKENRAMYAALMGLLTVSSGIADLLKVRGYRTVPEGTAHTDAGMD
jgi:hypothetical protein